MLTWGLVLIGSLAWLSAAHPVEFDAEPQWLLREKRSPMAARTIILIRGQPVSGYPYERSGRVYSPQSSMAAYATGSTVAAGSFYGGPYRRPSGRLVDEQPAASQPEEETSASEEPEQGSEAPEEEPKPAEEAVPEETPAVVDTSKNVPAPERQPKANKSSDDDDDDDDEPPRKRGRGGSVFKNFFPVVFGGGSGGARSADGDGSQGVAAIANSFSQGRGAVATSSATAYGSPPPQSSRYRA